MPIIITFTPLKPPQRTTVTGRGRSLIHECQDPQGNSHRQRLALGSVRGVFYLDAMCLHCGAHCVWVEDDAPPPAMQSEPAPEPG